MQRVRVSQLTPGMITARNILDAEGRMLLAADKVITESYIRRLKEIDVYAIYVRNPLFDDVEVPLVLSEETRIQSMQTVKRAFEVLRNKRADISFEEIQAVSRRIVAEVLRNRRALVHLTEIRSHDDYTFSHSVDVCSLSVLTASHMGYTEVKLQELATGALLHDIGKTKIEPALINKRAALNQEEKIVMRSHAMLGFDLLRNCQGTMTLPSIHIALQHHEQYNGDGYPRGLSNGEIHEYSRIVAIADVYDAITSDRPYRKAMLPHEAYELMLVKGSQHFDPMILPIFLQRIAIYPVGTVVRLNTGDIGVVLSVPPKMPLRPTLRLILDKKRRLYPGVVEFDMQNHLTSFIDQVVDGQDLLKLI